MIPLEKWPSLNASDISHLDKATEQVHHAVQFISMAGKYFIPYKADDSHTNMSWDLESQLFLGRTIVASQAIRLALKPVGLRLIFLDADEEERLISLSLFDHTRKEVLSKVKSILIEFGLDTSKYDLQLHYDLPDHPLLHSDSFSELEPEDYVAFSKVRSMGELVLQDQVSNMGREDPVRTWPHHFDHGVYLSQGADEQGDYKSISLGLAIADSVIDEYYFYITHWYRDRDLSYDHLPTLPAGYWNRNSWTGAVLPLSEILRQKKPADQIALIASFFEAAVPASLQLIG